jgi:putative lipoic acid-binding regulatory protein
MSWDTEGFREKLESQHTFPGLYIFKFIVPAHAAAEVEALWTDGEITLRPSSKGNYVSVTIHAHLTDAEEVITVYRNASRIEGCIAL